ncbi:MAG: cobyric acid synthase CobQ, partial [Pikeienuella sp.]
GAISPNGLAIGAYVHGVFGQDQFRACFLKEIGGSGAVSSYDSVIDDTLDQLADHLDAHLDLDALHNIAITYRQG